jgi:hypothetical protein
MLSAPLRIGCELESLNCEFAMIHNLQSLLGGYVVLRSRLRTFSYCLAFGRKDDDWKSLTLPITLTHPEHKSASFRRDGVSRHRQDALVRRHPAIGSAEDSTEGAQSSTARHGLL